MHVRRYPTATVLNGSCGSSGVCAVEVSGTGRCAELAGLARQVLDSYIARRGPHDPRYWRAGSFIATNGPSCWSCYDTAATLPRCSPPWGAATRACGAWRSTRSLTRFAPTNAPAGCSSPMESRRASLRWSSVSAFENWWQPAAGHPRSVAHVTLARSRLAEKDRPDDVLHRRQRESPPDRGHVARLGGDWRRALPHRIRESVGTPISPPAARWGTFTG